MKSVKSKLSPKWSSFRRVSGFFMRLNVKNGAWVEASLTSDRLNGRAALPKNALINHTRMTKLGAVFLFNTKETKTKAEPRRQTTTPKENISYCAAVPKK
jgi:hypothetical protein